MSELQMSFPLSGNVAIPAVGFGTYLVPTDDAPDTVATAIGIGYRHIDTAEGYRNEEGVGAGLRAGMAREGLSRQDLFVTTKLWPGNPEWGQTPKSMEETMASCRASLERLGLDQVDLYLIHSPQGGAARLDQWRALVELKHRGLARAIGVSNYKRSHLEEIADAGLPAPDANQIELHPWSQKPDLVAYLRDKGIAPLAYSSLVPLSTWRADPGQDSAKTDAMRAEGARADSPFVRMARKYGVSEAQVLLRWGVQSGFAVLPKSGNPVRMRQNLDLFSFEIDDADMALIATMDRGDGLAWATGDPSLVGLNDPTRYVGLTRYRRRSYGLMR